MLTPFTFSNPPFLGNVGQENPSASEDFVLYPQPQGLPGQ